MKNAVIIELLYHHECLEQVKSMLQDEGYNTISLLGDSVAKKIPNYSTELILDQSWRQRRHDVRPNTRINKIQYGVLGCLMLGELFFHFIRIIFYLKKHSFDLIYINTPNNILMLPLLATISLLGIPWMTTMHHTGFGGPGLGKISSYALKVWHQKAEKNIILAKYLIRPQDVPISTKLVLNNRKALQGKLSLYDTFTVLIPGKYDPLRKNIAPIVKGVLEYNKANSTNPIRILMMGDYNHKQLSEEIGCIVAPEWCEILTGFVPDQIYQEVLLRSHIIAVCTYPTSNYGTYKITGAYGDAIAANKPILAPEWYAPHYDLGENVCIYKEETIVSILGTVVF